VPATTPFTPRTPATPSPHAGAASADVTWPVALAVGLDAACVLGFAAAGRSTHAEDGGLVGALGTAWPFLVACALGWLVARAWRRPARVWPTGVLVWALTWAGGLGLRGLAGEGLAPAFVAVAAVVLAVLLVGWRGLATTVSSVRRGRARRRTNGSAPRR
jgi:hypothetical protein